MKKVIFLTLFLISVSFAQLVTVKTVSLSFSDMGYGDKEICTHDKSSKKIVYRFRIPEYGGYPVIEPLKHVSVYLHLEWENEEIGNQLVTVHLNGQTIGSTASRVGSGWKGFSGYGRILKKGDNELSITIGWKEYNPENDCVTIYKDSKLPAYEIKMLEYHVKPKDVVVSDPFSISRFDYRKGRNPTFVIVVGENAPELDRETARKISEDKKYALERLPQIINDTSVTEETYSKYHMIVVGGPVVNKISVSILNKMPVIVSNANPGWGKGTLQYIKNPFGKGKDIILVAGSDRDGTKKAGNVLIDIM
ncbi:MAG: S-layer protein [Candidatus Hydrothermarchaeota archaeon]